MSSAYLILLSAMVAIFGGFVAFIVLGVRRRKRLWFVGGGRSALARLTELKALQLRELKDLEEAFETGKIAPSSYEGRKNHLMKEIAETAGRVEEAQAIRDSLRERFTLPLLMIGLVALASPAFSQEIVPIKVEHKAADGIGAIEITLEDRLNPVRDFSDVIVVAMVLEENALPFNEMTQSNWTGSFRKIASMVEGVDPPSGIGNVMSVQRNTPKGYVWKSSPSGKFTVNSVLTQQRLALAAYHQGMWWPMAGERFLPPSGVTRYAKIPLSDISTDTKELEIFEYLLDVAPAPDTGTGLRWHQVEVNETIIIRNPTNKAISGPANEDGEAWINLLIPSPPGIDPSEMLNLMASSWDVFVGVPTLNIDGEDPLSLEKGVAPYKPWSKGLDWGPAAGGGMGNHGAAPARTFDVLGAKDSGSITHPLNLEGKYEAYGPGDIGIVTKGDAMQINIYKPVPANGTLVVKLRYKPGIFPENPQPIVIDRSYLSAGIRDFRALVDARYEFFAQGMEIENSEDLRNQQGQHLLVAKKGKDGYVGIPNSALKFGLAATPAFAAFIKEEDAKEAAADKAAQALKPRIAPQSKPEDDGGLKFSSTMWLMSVLFGLGLIISIVWMFRRDALGQLAQIEGQPIDEEEALVELSLMRQEVKEFKIPDRVYLKERNRIIEGMISSKLHNQPKE